MTGIESAQISRPQCAQRDSDDALRRMRDRFSLPEGVIYLDGNSLGALPKATAGRVEEAIRGQWGCDLIKSWNVHQWVDLPQRMGGKLARLLGARPNEVIIADSTSVNVFKLLAGLLQRNDLDQNGSRRVILSEIGNFPTDLYVAQGLNALLGGRYQLRLVEPGGIEAALDPGVAAALITQVDYRSGRQQQMAALNAAARAAGTHIIWDLSHSAGALPLALIDCGAELAVGCGYKYLNGGPGAPAYLYVSEAMQAQFPTPLSGWFGHAAPFAFAPDFQPAPGIERFLCGTPPVLGCLALDCGIATFDDVSMAAVREKSLALSDMFWALMDQHCREFGFRCIAPRSHGERGSQLSFAHEQAYAIMQAIIERGVIGDFRQPDLLRFGFTPLYTRFVDAWDAVMIIRDVMLGESWRNPKYLQRNAVT
jgi:kynureninase